MLDLVFVLAIPLFEKVCPQYPVCRIAAISANRA